MMSPYDAAARLASAAGEVRGGRTDPVPPLLVLTDPKRQPDPVALAKALPPGCGLIYRHFGAANRLERARKTVEIAAEKGICVLVSGDVQLARLSGADGVHWPERLLPLAHQARARGNTQLFTASVHSATGLSRAQTAGVDAVLISTVFASQSPSAGRPMGPLALAAHARRSRVPACALGGVTTDTIGRLKGLGISGIAVVGAIRSAGPTRT